MLVLFKLKCSERHGESLYGFVQRLVKADIAAILRYFFKLIVRFITDSVIAIG